MRDLNTDTSVNRSAQSAIENNVQHFISAHNDGAEVDILDLTAAEGYKDLLPGDPLIQKNYRQLNTNH